MKFRSWYVVLLGILLQAGLGLLFIASGKDADAWGGLIGTILGIIWLLPAGLGIPPLILLVSDKTRKAGAIVSIVFGIIGVIIGIGIIIGVFLLTAGIISLWRKI